MGANQQMLLGVTPTGGAVQETWIFSDNTTGDYIGVDGGLDDVFLSTEEQTTNQSTGSNPNQLFSREGEFPVVIRAPGLSSIPSSRVVTSVTIGLYREDGNGGTPEGHFARLVDGRAWVESEATWLIYSTGNSWGTAGAFNDTTDVAGGVTTSGTQALLATQNAWNEFSTAGLVTDANAVIAGTNENNGWRFAVEGTYARFRSSRGTDGLRPYILIETDPA